MGKLDANSLQAGDLDMDRYRIPVTASRRRPPLLVRILRHGLRRRPLTPEDMLRPEERLVVYVLGWASVAVALSWVALSVLER